MRATAATRSRDVQSTGATAAPSARTPRLWLDVGAVSALSLISVLGFQPAFGQFSFLIAAVGGLIIGTGAALAGYLLRFSMLATVALAIAAYILVGTPLTMPQQGIAGVLPSLDSLSGLVRGAVFGWSDALTLRTPLEAPPYIAVVPYAATWVVSLVAVSLVCRWLPHRRRRALSTALLVIPALLLYVAAVLLGTRVPFLADARGVLFTAVALLWIGWRDRRPTGGTDAHEADDQDAPRASSGWAAHLPRMTAALRKRLIGTGVVVLGAVLVGAVAGSALTPVASDRFVLRQQVTPPFNPLKYPSPLAGFRRYTNTLEHTTLFTVRGAQAGTHVRLATMDSYNGVVWSVAPQGSVVDGSGSFQLLGRSIPTPPLFTSGGSSSARIDITNYDDVWLPSFGYLSTLDFDSYRGTDPRTTVRVNTTTGTTAVTSGVGSGLDYTMGIDEQRIPSDKQLAHVPAAKVEMPPVTDVPDVVTAKAKEYAGTAATTIQKLRNIERSLKTFGYLSHGRASDPVPSRAGEGSDRMIQLLTAAPMVGDQEQYATVFALMAYELGYPVRVVMGFSVPSASSVSEQGGSGSSVASGAPDRTSTGAVAVTGNDVTAWDEVAFQGVGWVPFYPTPTKTDAPKQQTTQPKLQPQPQVRQPPRTNPKDDQLLTPVKTKNDKQNHKKPGFTIPAWATIGGSIVGVLVLLYAIPVLVLLAIKLRRRRRRARGSPDRRAAGAWAELTDGFAELGYRIPQPATRKLTALALERQSAEQGIPITADELQALAARVDSAVFGGEAADAGAGAALTVWSDVERMLARVRSSAGWLRRRLAGFRLRRDPRLSRGPIRRHEPPRRAHTASPIPGGR